MDQRNSVSKFSSIFGRQKPRVVARDSNQSFTDGSEPERSPEPQRTVVQNHLQKSIKLQSPRPVEPETRFSIPDYETLQNKLREIKDTLNNQSLGGQTEGTQQTTVQQPRLTSRVPSGGVPPESFRLVKTPYVAQSIQQNQINIPQQATHVQNAYGSNVPSQQTATQPAAQPAQMHQPAQYAQRPQTKTKMYLVRGQKYISIRELGSGGSAKVYRVMTPDGQMYAMKIVNLNDDQDDQLNGLSAIKQELGILEALRGKQITMDLINYEIADRQVFIVMELGDLDLKNYLRENSILSEHRIAVILEDMCDSLAKMHNSGYIHGDLKPQNFMFHRCKLKLIDFGISKRMQEGDTMIVRDTLAGTPKYMAPEVIKSKLQPDVRTKIHRASDVWSVGAILYEMVCGQSAFQEVFQQVKGQPYPFMVKIMNGEYQINWNIRCSVELRDLMMRCLEYDDGKRITLVEIQRHRFLTGR